MTVLISGTAWVKAKQAAPGTGNFLDALILQTVFSQLFCATSLFVLRQLWWNPSVASDLLGGMTNITCFQCSSYNTTCGEVQSLWHLISLAEIKTIYSEKGNWLLNVNHTKTAFLSLLCLQLDHWNNWHAEWKVSLLLTAVKSTWKLAKRMMLFKLLRSKKYSIHSKRQNAASVKNLS